MRRGLGIPVLGLLACLWACERPFSVGTSQVAFSAAAVDTRTAFTAPEDDTYPVVWTAEDRSVLISLNGGTGVEASVTAATDGRSAHFKASFTDPGGACTFQALSPASAFEGLSEEGWRYAVPAEQTPSAKSVDPAAMVLCATSASFSALPSEVPLSFTHLTAYGRLTLLHAPADIRGVSLSFADGPALTIHTTVSDGIWFGIKPLEVGGQKLHLRIETGAGYFEKNVTFPAGRSFEAGQIARFSVDLADATFEPRSRSISVLAIGNSFSIDAMEYLYGYLRQAGYEDVFLGNLYIGGCSLQTHAGHLSSGAGAYEYRTNSNGSWSSSLSYSALDALSSRDWDIVTLQQASGFSGVADSFEPYLTQVIQTVRARCPGARLLWHQTWAYQRNSSHSDFGKYGCVQIRMYQAIVDAVRSQVLPRSEFSGVIPCGTAIQNLRTSFIGDTVTRDGYHMSYAVGRATTGLMWLKYLTGCPLEGIDPTPAGYSLSARQMAAMKEAVEQAYAAPLSVSVSTDPPALSWASPDASLREVLSGAGYDPSKYRELPYSLTYYAFYNSGSGSVLTSREGGSTANNLDEFAATQFFSREDIPVGSVLVLKSGYQYRPERWTRLSAATNPRPDQTKTQVFAVTDAWWSGTAYRAFNLSKAGNPHLSEAEMASLGSCFAIFVPVQ